MIWRVPVGKGAGKVMPISQRTFGTAWFDKFIKDNNIKDANGDYYNIQASSVQTNSWNRYAL